MPHAVLQRGLTRDRWGLTCKVCQSRWILPPCESTWPIWPRPHWDCGDHVGLHHYYAKQLSIGAARGQVQFEEVEFVDGIENPAEAFPNIVRWMVKHDYSDGDIAKAIGGNVMRVLEEAWFR